MKNVSFDKANKRYRARVYLKGEVFHLGNFPTEQQAFQTTQKVLTSAYPLDEVYKIQTSRTWGKQKW